MNGNKTPHWTPQDEPPFRENEKKKKKNQPKPTQTSEPSKDSEN
jgi:hypothetical protein